jgi:probable phosphoglycerate mutase
MSADADRRPQAGSLFVIRHGQTDYNARDLLLGRRDIPLNEVGREQAVANGRSLPWLVAGAEHLDFYCGPLARTVETMHLLRTAAGLDSSQFKVDDALIELDYGQWEGLTWEQVREQDPEGYQAWHADPVNYRLPGGESYAQLTARLEAFLARRQRGTVIVSHGGISRVMLGLLGGVERALAIKIAIPQDRIMGLHAGAFAWLSAGTELHLR